MRIPAGVGQKLILIIKRGSQGEFVLEEFFDPVELGKRKLAVGSWQYQLVAAATCLPEGYLRFEDSAVSRQITRARRQLAEGGIRFATAVRVRYGSDMSTVQEIEAAADLLPADKKEELLRFLAVRLRKDRAQPQPRIYSAEEVAAMVAEDEADGERFRQGR